MSPLVNAVTLAHCAYTLQNRRHVPNRLPNIASAFLGGSKCRIFGGKSVPVMAVCTKNVILFAGKTAGFSFGNPHIWMLLRSRIPASHRLAGSCDAWPTTPKVPQLSFSDIDAN